jgi:hypothetical protein
MKDQGESIVSQAVDQELPSAREDVFSQVERHFERNKHAWLSPEAEAVPMPGQENTRDTEPSEEMKIGGAGWRELLTTNPEAALQQLTHLLATVTGAVNVEPSIQECQRMINEIKEGNVSRYSSELVEGISQGRESSEFGGILEKALSDLTKVMILKDIDTHLNRMQKEETEEYQDFIDLREEFEQLKAEFVGSWHQRLYSNFVEYMKTNLRGLVRRDIQKEYIPKVDLMDELSEKIEEMKVLIKKIEENYSLLGTFGSQADQEHNPEDPMGMYTGSVRRKQEAQGYVRIYMNRLRQELSQAKEMRQDLP